MSVDIYDRSGRIDFGKERILEPRERGRLLDMTEMEDESRIVGVEPLNKRGHHKSDHFASQWRGTEHLGAGELKELDGRANLVNL